MTTFPNHSRVNSMTDYYLQHQVKSFDCDVDLLMTPICFQLLCQEITAEHAESYGYGYAWVTKNQKAWILRQLDIEWIRRPAWKEEITLRTNSGKPTELHTTRYVEMLDKRGNVIAKCDTRWIIIDYKTRQPIPLKHAGLPHTTEGPYSPLTSPIENMTWQDKPLSISELVVPKSAEDMNGHVNNSVFLKWIEEGIPADLMQGLEMKRYCIKFLCESYAGDHIKVAHYKQGNQTKHLVMSGDELRTEIVIVWGKTNNNTDQTDSPTPSDVENTPPTEIDREHLLELQVNASVAMSTLIYQQKWLLADGSFGFRDEVTLQDLSHFSLIIRSGLLACSYLNELDALPEYVQEEFEQLFIQTSEHILALLNIFEPLNPEECQYLRSFWIDQDEMNA